MSHRFLANVRRLATTHGARLCFALVLLAVVLPHPASAEPVYSRSKKFRIPFQFDVAELRRLGAREIQLYVSQDQGGHWTVGEAVSPDQSKFSFEAPSDGEYWFSVKTRTSGGLEYPAGPHQPGLQVIVDTAPPELELQVSEVEPGRVRLNWEISDAAPDYTSLKLETLDPGATSWHPLSLRPQKQGETTWTIADGGQVQAQATVTDLAGNVTTRKVEARVAAPLAKPRPVDDTQPIAQLPPEHSGVMANAPPPRNPLVRPQTNKIVPLVDALAKANPPVTAVPLPAGPAIAPPAAVISAPHADAPVFPPSAVNVNTGSLPAPSQAAIAPLGVSPIHHGPTSPIHVQHRVNSSAFKIEYEIEGIGSSGVGNVELYISETNGQTWFHYGVDADRVSPVEISVPTDGQYGFAFRVSNGLGLVELPPQPGERPEVSILVDRTPPQAKLWPVIAGAGEASQQVTISWTAGDPDLAQQPISLLYSAQQGGPWEPISVKLANTGRYQWNIPSQLTQKFYVRLEVCDAAGNVTAVDSEQPFLVDRARPKARVKVVESLKAGAR